jgi:hypothetical protein
MDAVIEHAIFFGGLIAGLLLGSWWPVIAAMIVLVLVMPWIVAVTRPLRAVTGEDVARDRRFRLYALASLALLALASLTFYRP